MRVLQLRLTFLGSDFQVVVGGLLSSRLAGISRYTPPLSAIHGPTRTEALRVAQLVTFDPHLLVVRDWRGWSVSLPNRDDVVNDYPRVVSTCENPVDILRTNVCHVLEGSPRVFVIQTPNIIHKLDDLKIM